MQVSVKRTDLKLKHPRVRKRLRPALLAAALCCAPTESALAEDFPSRVDQLKAGYVLNFAKFVEWPAPASSDDLVICVAGNRGIYEALRTGTTTATVGSRRVAIRSVESAASASGCHVLYLELTSPVQPVSIEISAPILTVSDGSGFAHAGGTIELFTQQNRLRFIINLENARRAGLRISSSLLQLAVSVEGGDRR